MFRSRTSSCPKKNYAFSAFCESDSASRAAAVLGAALIPLFKLAAPPRKPEVSSTTRACLSQTGAGWYLTPLVFACGFGTHGDAAKRKRNANNSKKGKPCFFAQPTTRIVHRLISRWTIPCCRLVQTRPRWTMGTPYNAHGRRPSLPGTSSPLPPPRQLPVHTTHFNINIIRHQRGVPP